MLPVLNVEGHPVSAWPAEEMLLAEPALGL